MAETEKIINCTPHSVSIYYGTLYDPDSGHSIGGTEVATIPPCGIVATAKSSIQQHTPLEVDGIPVPTCKRQFSAVTPLPTSTATIISFTPMVAKSRASFTRSSMARLLNGLLIPGMAQ